MKKAPLRGCVRYRKGLCARRIFLPQAGLKKPRSALGSFAARAPNPVQLQYITAVSESHLPDSSLRRKTSGAGLLPASGGRPHQGKSFSREIFLPAGSTGNTQIKMAGRPKKGVLSFFGTAAIKQMPHRPRASRQKEKTGRRTRSHAAAALKTE